MIRPFVRHVARIASFCLRTLLVALVTRRHRGGRRRAGLGEVARRQARLVGQPHDGATGRKSSAVLIQRGVAKESVIDHLVAGELSLVEAASWFRYLNENPGRVLHGLPPTLARRQ